MSIVHHWLNESKPNNDNNNTTLTVQRTKRQQKKNNKHHLTSIKVDVVFICFFSSLLCDRTESDRDEKRKIKIQSENKTMKVTTSNYIF